MHSLGPSILNKAGAISVVHWGLRVAVPAPVLAADLS